MFLYLCLGLGEKIDPEIEEDNIDPAVVATVASAAAMVALSAIITPLPLGIGTPQGLPQPTDNPASIGNGGGGSTPAMASSVIKMHNSN